MARIYSDLTELVGNTPLLEIKRLTDRPLHGRLLAKLEFYNPASSVKDRTALAIVRAAEKDGRLKPGGTILEATSGNTGVAFAWIGAILGYRVMIVMPDDVSTERYSLMRALGAEVRFTPGADGMAGANQLANRLVEDDPSLFLSGQGGNAANPAVHEHTTGPEIWQDTEGLADVLVGTTGTGGTISGAGRFLKGKKPGFEVYGVEPAEAAVLSGQEWHPHKIQGITGGNGVPPVTDLDVIDGMLTVPQDEAISMARHAFRAEGLIVGISSGASLHAGLQLATDERYAGKTIVAIVCDTGERYISSELFDHVR